MDLPDSQGERDQSAREARSERLGIAGREVNRASEETLAARAWLAAMEPQAPSVNQGRRAAQEQD